MSELKPCPWCGTIPVTESYREGNGTVYWSVECHEETCAIKPMLDNWALSEDLAIGQWNMREDVRICDE